MKYKAGYKYVLAEPSSFLLPARFEQPSFGDIETEFLYLSGRKLDIGKGYAWDGASGPTWDDKTNMQAALVHDALYQLLREGLLPATLRKEADLLFYRMLREDGMGRIRAWYYYQAVRIFGAKAASREGKRPVLTAP